MQAAFSVFHLLKLSWFDSGLDTVTSKKKKATKTSRSMYNQCLPNANLKEVYSHAGPYTA